ncbi:MAG: UDP-N-acetylglucosamine 2-epimerase, partial [Fimbriimonadaceae bacterium]|nr:UDP-N-acetylglucosamine 2-epimerase [Alphaproteobacteria bacterium]
VKLSVIATGMHLAPQFGETWKAIEADGFSIAAKVDLGLEDDTRVAIAHNTGRGIISFADTFDELAPDLVLVLGDRYEILSAATAALLLGIPIAHIHGGEVTEGAFDDAIRHAISKMANIHFTAAEPYTRRLIQMGEAPALVFTVGAPGLDHILEQTSGDRQAVLSALDVGTWDRYFLITLHPETMNLSANAPMATAMLEALNAFPDHGLIFTGVNADPGNQVIDDAVKSFAAAHPDRAIWRVSLGSSLYGQALKHADAVIGNSSSGIIEAPATGTPTVNIGARQDGRLRAASIIDCAANKNQIKQAIKCALSPAFKTKFVTETPPYGRGGASNKIAAIIAEFDLSQLGSKGFHDL